MDTNMKTPPEGLNQKEVDVLWLLKKGWSDKEIADHLKLSTAAVKGRMLKIYTKFGLVGQGQKSRKLIASLPEYNLPHPSWLAEASA